MDVLRERVPPTSRPQVRDFLAVHNKGGHRAPMRHAITEVSPGGFVTRTVAAVSASKGGPEIEQQPGSDRIALARFSWLEDSDPRLEALTITLTEADHAAVFDILEPRLELPGLMRVDQALEAAFGIEDFAWGATVAQLDSIAGWTVLVEPVGWLGSTIGGPRAVVGDRSGAERLLECQFGHELRVRQSGPNGSSNSTRSSTRRVPRRCPRSSACRGASGIREQAASP